MVQIILNIKQNRKMQYLIILGAVLIVAAVAFGSNYYYNYQEDRNWVSKFKFIHELKNYETYTIQKITSHELDYGLRLLDFLTTKEYLMLSQNNQLMDDEENTAIFYDTIKQNFWIYIKKRLADNDPQIRYGVPYIKEWVNFDLDGNILSTTTDKQKVRSNSLMALIDEAEKNYIDWENISNTLSIIHFTKMRFHYETLNPFRRYGNPNYQVTYDWDGVSYWKLKMKNSSISFKTQSSKKDNQYNTPIGIYRLPEKFNATKEIAFIRLSYPYGGNFNPEDLGLYLISTKK